MIQSLSSDRGTLTATEPEHCHDCFRLVRTGQTYYLAIEQEVLCADCALVEEIFRVRDDLAVEVKRDRLLVRCGKEKWKFSRARFDTWSML